MTDKRKTVSLEAERSKRRIEARRASPDPSIKLRAELEYRTSKLTEEIDKLNEKLETLQKLLLKAIKTNL